MLHLNQFFVRLHLLLRRVHLLVAARRLPLVSHVLVHHELVLGVMRFQGTSLLLRIVCHPVTQVVLLFTLGHMVI